MDNESENTTASQMEMITILSKLTSPQSKIWSIALYSFIVDGHSESAYLEHQIEHGKPRSYETMHVKVLVRLYMISYPMN